MSSKLQTFGRVIKLGRKNFWRNRWLTLGATLLMTLTLTMISVSLIMTFLLRDSANSIRSKIDLTIYFRDDSVPDQKITSLADRIKTLTNVSAVHFVNKTEALSIWNRLPINEEIKKPVTTENNPLPRSIQINTVDPGQLPDTIKAIQTIDQDQIICSECVSYAKNKETVDKLVSITRFVQRAGIFLSLFFGVIAIFNVFNIIRITITARSDEIEIMRYVGASNMFVRGPFIVEGVLYGLLGTAVTTVFLLIVAKVASNYVAQSSLAGSPLGFFEFSGLDFYHYLLSRLGTVVLFELLIGVLLGVVVSSLSIRRYLRL